MSERALLVVAGHDSSGRAGVDADREMARALGFEAEPVVTAWTRQDTGAVRAIEPVPADDVLRAAQRALERRPNPDGEAASIRALKIGLLPSVEHVEAVAVLVNRMAGDGIPIVADPVFGATTGEAFLDEAGIERWRELLLRPGVVVTPNLPEAARLLGRDERELALDEAARLDAAEALLELGVAGVVLKGGHGAEDPIRDLMHEAGGAPAWSAQPRVRGGGIRGSGCRHATAVACGLADGLTLAEAGRNAARRLAERIREATG